MAANNGQETEVPAHNLEITPTTVGTQGSPEVYGLTTRKAENCLDAVPERTHCREYRRHRDPAAYILPSSERGPLP
jgi:hypothetical protein